MFLNTGALKHRFTRLRISGVSYPQVSAPLAGRCT